MIRSLFVVLALCSACATTVHPVGSERNAFPSENLGADVIRWPAQYAPDEARFFVTNTIDIAAPPEVVWDILINAGQWESYYDGASDLALPVESGGLLADDTVFSWKTMGLSFTSTIEEFEPPYRLAWESRRPRLVGYHAWLIIPTDEGCRLLTEESQYGFLATMEGIFIPNKLHRRHDMWLEAIRERAEATAEVALTE